VSRLDSMIRRLTAQRMCIDEAARLLAGRPGCVFELGLGNGRTFDHLREVMPDREIFAFDRAIGAHPKCIPDATHLILGEIRETLQFCGPRIPGKPVLINIDLGTSDPTQDLITMSWLSPRVAEWVAPGTIVVADRRLEGTYRELPKPEGCPASGHLMLQAE
jgi:hypothetical protein